MDHNRRWQIPLQINDGAPALVGGVAKLKDGSMQLSDGLKQFNEEGINKIAEWINNDFDGIASRLRATVKVSKNYRNFAGISDDISGQVKFVYRTESID